MISVVCWKWEPLSSYRSTFKAVHVNTLYSMLKKNVTIPFRFSCITDNPEGIYKDVNIIKLWDDCKDVQNPNKQLSPSCYRRLKAFSAEAKDIIGDRIFSIDLDCVITGNIDAILDRKEDFVCLKGTAKRTPYNGGMWLLKAGSKKEVWNTFDPETSPSTTRKAGLIGSDQGWISYVLGPSEKTWDEADGVYCFRDYFVKRRNVILPKNAKIIMFQGKDDPWSSSVCRKYEWVNQYYKWDLTDDI